MGEILKLIAVLVFAAVAAAALPASAQVGVAPVVLGRGYDATLQRSIDKAIYLELRARGHEYLPPGSLAQHVDDVDREQALGKDFWLAVAKETAVDSILVVRAEVGQDWIALTITVFHADGSRKTATGKGARADAVEHTRKLVGQVIGYSAEIEWMVTEVERAVGRDLDGGYVRFQRRYGATGQSYAGYWMGRMEAKQRRGRILSFVVAPLILVACGAGAAGFFVAAHRDEEEKKKLLEDDEDYPASLDTSRHINLWLGGIFTGLGVLGFLIPFSTGIYFQVQARTAMRSLHPLMPDYETAAKRGIELELSPLIGPDGPMGAAAALRF
jgi:hypothetical protein